MKKTNKMYLVAKLTGFSNNELQQRALDWLSFVRILANPINYRIGKGDFLPFDFLTIKKQLASLDKTSELQMKINGEGTEFQIQITNNTLLEQAIIDSNNFLEQATVIEDYLDNRMKNFGIYGYIRSFDDYLSNNIEHLEKRLFNTPSEIKELPKRYTKTQELIVDCNQLAGYDLYYKGLCFTACWKMYITPFYYSLIPKPIFAEVQKVHAVEELNEYVVKITLFKDPFRWDLPANLADQRMLRDQLGFDQLAWSNGVGVLREPFIEFAYVGDVIQTVQYQNHFYQPVAKKKATYFVTRGYDIIQKNYTEHRTKGTLNAQAYFPWIDERSKKMMNYRVLDPNLALDKGISAYEFYIRQFLEIEIRDQNYDSFLSVLRFYLPKEALDNLPLEALQYQLDDVNILNLKKDADVTRFDLQKAKNHLRVIFMDYSHLEDLKETFDIAE